MIITDRIPDVGMVKQRNPITGDAEWIVTVSVHGLTAASARQLAAELLNAADDVERLTGESR